MYHCQRSTPHTKTISAATSAAALFIRSYERGERVHLAMLSRGFDGNLPQSELRRVGVNVWLKALSISIIALLISILTQVIG